MNDRLRRMVKIPLWMPTRASRRLQQAVTELNQTVEGFIAAGRSRDRAGDDLLSRLLLARHEDGARMSDRQMRDEAMTLYLAGHETTALTLAWTWYLLSQHPRVEEKLVSEWQRVLRGATPTTQHLLKLTYTSAVIAESAPLSIARRMEIPRRIIVILEGEGLANDATALILYRFAIGAI